MEYTYGLGFFSSQVYLLEKENYIRAAGQRIGTVHRVRWAPLDSSPAFILVLCITGYVFVWFPIDSFGRISDSFLARCPRAQIGKSLRLYDGSNKLNSLG